MAYKVKSFRKMLDHYGVEAHLIESDYFGLNHFAQYKYGKDYDKLTHEQRLTVANMLIASRENR